MSISHDPPATDKSTVSANGEAPAKPALTVVASNAKPAKEAWIAKLIRSGTNGPPKPVLANALLPLREAAAWRGVLRYDALALRVEVSRPPPWVREMPEDGWKPRPWTDQDDRLCAEWLQRQGILIGPPGAADAAETVAYENSFHPVREYLRSLKWDGTSRLNLWLHTYFGAEPLPYHELVGSKWIISAVARAMKPGEKVDCMLILEGRQGLGKGRSLAALMPKTAWLSTDVKEFGSLESARSLAGRWIIESAELEGLRGKQGNKPIGEDAKAFLSRDIDIYRAPYGRRTQDHPRQCIFAGTTNQAESLTDITGNRRFWPVACQQARPDELIRDRDQLWAEALHRYQQGEKWWLETSEDQAVAAEQQEARVEGDPLEEKIAAYLEGKDEVTTSDLFAHLEYPTARWTTGEARRLGGLLRKQGWSGELSRRGETRNKNVFRPKLQP